MHFEHFGWMVRSGAMKHLANGLGFAKHYADAVSVKEAELAMLRRLDASEERMLAVEDNLAVMYHHLGRLEEAIRMLQEAYSG